MDNMEVILILTSIPFYHCQHILVTIIPQTAEVLLHAQHVFGFPTFISGITTLKIKQTLM